MLTRASPATRRSSGATGASPGTTGTSRQQFVDRFVDRDQLSWQAHNLTEDGEVPVSAGDVTYVPGKEWHGYRSGDGDTHVFAGEIAVGRSRDGGYELMVK